MGGLKIERPLYEHWLPRFRPSWNFDINFTVEPSWNIKTITQYRDSTSPNLWSNRSPENSHYSGPSLKEHTWGAEKVFMCTGVLGVIICKYWYTGIIYYLLCIHAFILMNLWVRMQLLVHTKINRWTSAITLLLYTWYFTFSTCYLIISHILHKKIPFRHGIAPNAFLFMPVGHIGITWNPGDAAQTNNWIMCLEKTHLCYWLKSCVRVRMR